MPHAQSTFKQVPLLMNIDLDTVNSPKERKWYRNRHLLHLSATFTVPLPIFLSPLYYFLKGKFRYLSYIIISCLNDLSKRKHLFILISLLLSGYYRTHST